MKNFIATIILCVMLYLITTIFIYSFKNMDQSQIRLFINIPNAITWNWNKDFTK